MRMHKFNELYEEITAMYNKQDVLINRITVLEKILQNVKYALNEDMIEYIDKAMRENEPNKENWKD